jgi:menaquinone-dependent protoporphyrinogen IX oxidase
MLTHFADEMLGAHSSVSTKMYTEEEKAFIMKAREALRDHPSALEMAKLRWVGCTA